MPTISGVTVMCKHFFKGNFSWRLSTEHCSSFLRNTNISVMSNNKLTIYKHLSSSQIGEWNINPKISSQAVLKHTSLQASSH
jgi:hypothetical protein